MTDLFTTAVLRLAKLTAKNKTAFYVFGLVMIPVCAIINLCEDHLPELWEGIKHNYTTLEEQRQEVLEKTSSK